jgi:hypothetical protein
MPVGNVSKSYISSINFLDQREILRQVLNITREETSFIDLMEMFGAMTPTGQPEYHLFVNEEQFIAGTVSVVTGTGPQVTITVDATFAASVQPGKVIMLAGGVNCLIISKTNNDLVIRNVDGTTAIQTLVTAVSPLNRVTAFTTAFGEASGSPLGERWGQTKFANQVQKFKAAYQITDIQKASKVETTFDGKEYIMYKGQHESLMKFRNEIAFGLFFSRKSAANFASASPSLTDAAGNPVQTTSGLHEQIDSFGLDDTLASASAVALSDMKDVDTLLNLNRSPEKYLIYVGGSMNQKYDDFLNNLGTSATLSTSARFDITGRDLDLGIDSWKIYGRQFGKKRLAMLDHKGVTNFTNSTPFKDYAYFTPVDEIKTIDGSSVPMVRVRYLEGDGFNGAYLETLHGRLAPNPDGEEDVLKVVYSAVMGLECPGAWHTLLQKHQ